MINKIVYFSFSIALLISHAAHGAEISKDRELDESTLCMEHEEIYFSCHLKGKGSIVSICSSANNSPKEGYIQYRYGTHENIELNFPKNKTPPQGIFSLTDVTEGSIRGMHIKFTRGAYTYVVSSVMPGGLYVIRNNKVVFDAYCSSGKNITFPDSAYRGVEQHPMTEVDLH